MIVINHISTRYIKKGIQKLNYILYQYSYLYEHWIATSSWYSKIGFLWEVRLQMIFIFFSFEKIQKSMWNRYPSEDNKKRVALSRTNGSKPSLVNRERQTCMPVRNTQKNCPIILQRRWESSRKAPVTTRGRSWALRGMLNLGQVRGYMAAHLQRLPWTLDPAAG